MMKDQIAIRSLFEKKGKGRYISHPVKNEFIENIKGRNTFIILKDLEKVDEIKSISVPIYELLLVQLGYYFGKFLIYSLM